MLICEPNNRSATSSARNRQDLLAVFLQEVVYLRTGQLGALMSPTPCDREDRGMRWHLASS
jgi:hypothetical protein